MERHRRYFPRLPLDHFQVLIVDSIGKMFSGTGMDTNVIGYRGVRDGEDLSKPDIHVIAALELHPSSKGNAIGVGLADFITRRLRDAIDEHKTFLNVYTTGHMGRAKIPVTFADDEELFGRIAERYGEDGWLKADRARQIVQTSRLGSSDVMWKVFTAAETGAAQAHADNPSLANEYIFDWLESRLGAAGRI